MQEVKMLEKNPSQIKLEGSKNLYPTLCKDMLQQKTKFLSDTKKSQICHYNPMKQEKKVLKLENLNKIMVPLHYITFLRYNKGYYYLTLLQKLKANKRANIPKLQSSEGLK